MKRSKALIKLLPPVFILVFLLTTVVTALMVEVAVGAERSGKSSLREIDVWSLPEEKSVLDEALLDAIEALPEVEDVQGIKQTSIHARSGQGSYLLTARTLTTTQLPPIIDVMEGLNEETLDGLVSGDVIVPEETQGTNFGDLIGEEVPMGFIVEVAPGQGNSEPDVVRIAGVYEASYEADGLAVAYATNETISRWRGAGADPLESDYEQLIVAVGDPEQVATVASTLRNMGLDITVVSDRTGDLGGFVRSLELAGIVVAFMLVILLGVTVVQAIRVTSSAMSTTLALLLVSGTPVKQLVQMLRVEVLKPISLYVSLASPLGALVAYLSWPGAELVRVYWFLLTVFCVVVGAVLLGWLVAGKTCRSTISCEMVGVLRDE